MPRRTSKRVINENLKNIDDKDFFKKANELVGGYFVNLEDEDKQDIERISTGIKELDDALGGGYARGRIIEIFGPEMSGKTWLLLKAYAENQRQGRRCAHFDVEQAFSPKYAKQNGVDLKTLLFTQDFEHAEDALEKVEKLCKSGVVDIIGVDSTAGLVPKMEMEADMDEQRPGVLARTLGAALRKIVKAASETDTVVIFINQLREKLGVTFGNPETTPGGRALKFFTSMRIRASAKNYPAKDRPDFFDEKSQRIGHALVCEVVKNKTFPPYKKVEVDLMYNPYRRLVQKVKDAYDIGLISKKIGKDGQEYVRDLIYNGINFKIDTKFDYEQMVEKIREVGLLCSLLENMGENLDLYVKSGDISKEELSSHKEERKQVLSTYEEQEEETHHKRGRKKKEE